MRKHFLLIFSFLTGFTQAQTTVSTKCDKCEMMKQKDLQVWQYRDSTDTIGTLWEFFESEDGGQSIFLDWNKREVTDERGHSYTLLQDLTESTLTKTVIYYDDYKFTVFYTDKKRYIGHKKTVAPQ